MTTTLFIVAICGYLTAIYNIFAFVKDKHAFISINTTIIVSWIAVIIHALILSHALINQNGINIGATNAFSLTVITTIVIIIPNLKRHPDIGLFLFVLAILSLIFSFSYRSQLNLNRATPLLSLHIILSIIAYAILMLVGVQAIIILLRHRLLKARHLPIFKHLPPLMSMEQWLFQLMLIGSVFLTLSLLSALPSLSMWFTKPFIHRSILSIASLLLFSSLLFAHKYKNLKGKRAAKYALIAFSILLVGVSGSRIIQEVIFNRTQ